MGILIFYVHSQTGLFSLRSLLADVPYLLFFRGLLLPSSCPCFPSVRDPVADFNKENFLSYLVVLLKII